MHLLWYSPYLNSPCSLEFKHRHFQFGIWSRARSLQHMKVVAANTLSWFQSHGFHLGSDLAIKLCKLPMHILPSLWYELTSKCFFFNFYFYFFMISQVCFRPKLKQGCRFSTKATLKARIEDSHRLFFFFFFFLWNCKFL